MSTINFVYYEKNLREKQDHEIRIAEDADYGKPGAKRFAISTWQVVYDSIYTGYQSGRPRHLYEFRDPLKACNFYVDIDAEYASESEFDEDEFLEKIQRDFAEQGITEPWKLQKSCGCKERNGKTVFKASYHITIPSVCFESHKHLKKWFKDRCSKTVENGKTVYKLGSTPIDSAVYQAGYWRFPMCSKRNSARVLNYDAEPMSLKVFKELSIHYVKPNARTIPVSLVPKQAKRKRVHCSGEALSAAEKADYGLVGDFVWGAKKEHETRIKATSIDWQCPAGERHESNRQVSISKNLVYCYACDYRYNPGKRKKIQTGLKTVLPSVPDIEPADLFYGTDECYAKIMMSWYGDKFIYSSKLEKLYYWNGNLWEDGVEMAFFKMEELYLRLLKHAEEQEDDIASRLDVQDSVMPTNENKALVEELQREINDAAGSLYKCSADYYKTCDKISKKKSKTAGLVARLEQQIAVALAANEKQKANGFQNEKRSLKAKAAHSIEKLKEKKRVQTLLKREAAECKKQLENALKVLLETCKIENLKAERACAVAQAALKKRKATWTSKKLQLKELQDTRRKKRVVEEFTRQCKRYLMSDIRMDINDAQRQYFHFKNGCVDLKTGTFRERRQADFVCRCLDYNYRGQDESVKKKMEEIKKILQMLQPKKMYYEWMMSWTGYCLTGETKDQKFNSNVGYSASNGKTTVAEMLTKCFPIYVKKIGNKAFDLGFSGWAKCFSAFLDTPYRYIWMNEWGNHALDEDRVCNFVDGKGFLIPVIYEKSEREVVVHGKLNTNGNNDPDFKGDTKGIFRRGVSTPFESVFCDDGTENEAECRYKADKSICEKFENIEYRLALFHLLVPYAKQYYEVGLTIPKECSSKFKKGIDDLDEFSVVFEHFEVTKSVDDIVSKMDVMEWMRNKAATRGIPPEMREWKHVLKKFKSMGVVYDSQFQKTVCIRGKFKRMKGFFKKLQKRKEVHGPETIAGV